MNIEHRTWFLIDKISALDAQFGRRATATNANLGNRARIITDQPSIWTAVLAPDYEPCKPTDPNQDQGGGWTLFQLWVYDHLRVTAHIRSEELAVRLYKPGAWESLFFLTDLPPIAPIHPGGYSSPSRGTPDYA